MSTRSRNFNILLSMLYIIIVVVNSTVCLNNEFSQSGSRRNESLTVKQYIRFKLFSKERWHVGLQCIWLERSGNRILLRISHAEVKVK